MLKVFHHKEFCEISGIQQEFKILSFIFVHVQSHIFKTIWLINRIFLGGLPKVIDILNQKWNCKYAADTFLGMAADSPMPVLSGTHSIM